MTRQASLTRRLTAYFAAGATTVLLAFGLLVMRSVENHFLEQDRMELGGKADLVTNILDKMSSADAVAGLGARLEEALTGHHHLAIRLTTPDGRLVYESPGDAFPRASFPTDTPDGAPAVRTWRDGDRAYRGLSTLVGAGTAGLPPLRLEASLDIGHHEAYLRAFRRTIWLSLAASTLLTGLIAWVAARRGLAPLRAMAGLAQRVSANRLADRLSIETLPAELVDLARAFNDMLARLEESFRQLSAFSSDLAHEFRTPLSNVLTHAQVALSRPRSVEEYRDALASTIEECDRLARTVEQMLFLARADHGLEVPSVEAVDVAAETREVIEFLDALACERGVSMACEGEATARGDRLMIRRALANLLSNALAHASPGGVVTVAIDATDDGFVRIAIANPGETIPPEHLPRLFDRFYRVDPARGRSSGGAGLGLAITRSIARAHGGRIEVESADGLTRFTLILPAGAP